MRHARWLSGWVVLFLAFSALAGPPDPDGIRQRMDDYLDRIERIGYSGVVLVGIGEEIVYVRGFGWANEQNKIPVRPDTVFTIGSITKAFTATAIMKLVEMGRIHVDDPMTIYFDHVPEDKRAITIHHLLTHSAGFPGAIGDDFEPIDREAFIERSLKTPLRFPPGRAYHYSNVGYSLLGAIIEKVTGKPYEVFLHEQVFKPAGMMDTGYVIPDWDPRRLAHGYIDGRDWGTVRDKRWAKDGPYWNLRANGGIHTTALDMFRWHRALRADNLLKAHTRALMFMPHMPEGPEARTHYGYGWVIARTRWGAPVYTHNGGNGIFFADYYRFPDDDLVIFFATNRARMGSDAVSHTVVRLVYHQPVELPPIVVEPDRALLQKITGTFEGPGRLRIEPTRSTVCLQIRAAPRTIIQLMAIAYPVDKTAEKKRRRMIKTFIRHFEARDYRSAFKSVDPTESTVAMGAMTKSIMKELETKHGRLRRLKFIEMYRRRDRQVVGVLEMRFEEARRFLELVWEEDTLEDVRLVDRIELGPFCHVGGGRFIRYRLTHWGGLELGYHPQTGVTVKTKDRRIRLKRPVNREPKSPPIKHENK